LETHDALANSIIDRHGGRLIRLTGDGLLATFDGPWTGHPMCIGLSGRSCTTRDHDQGAGLHSGEVEQRGEDIGGIAVHPHSSCLSFNPPIERVI
jgi:class 3 adenylate cyclase